jgi:alpha-glucoside transport system substrate-binding protein
MTLSRRSVLKALTLPVLTGLGAVGCGSGERTVQVAVVWTDWELTQFERVMNEFSRRYNIGYSLLSMGDDTTAFLSNEVTASAEPDVALVPQPGLVLSDSTRKLLAQVDWPSNDAPSWRSLLAIRAGSQSGGQYGVWFKAAHESMVWHGADLQVPSAGWDWDTWVRQCQALAGRGRPPLSIGAADGWVPALWFANVLLSIDPPLYHSLAVTDSNGPVGGPGPTWDNPKVRLALTRLADVWRIDGVFPGGPERALVTQFDQSVLDVFGSGDAAMVVGADFFWPIIKNSTTFPLDQVRWFRFPSKPGENGPVVVAGDAAVLFPRPGRESYGRQLIGWLQTPDAAKIWAGAGGYLSINDKVTVSDYHDYPASMHTDQLIQDVSQGWPPANSAAFDLADVLGGPLLGGDGAGTWKIFTDFFTAVAVKRSAVPDAIDAVVTALDQGQGGS